MVFRDPRVISLLSAPGSSGVSHRLFPTGLANVAGRGGPPMYLVAPERRRVFLFPGEVSISCVRRSDPALLGIPRRARSYVGGPIAAHGLTFEHDLVSSMDQAVEYDVGPTPQDPHHFSGVRPTALRPADDSRRSPFKVLLMRGGSMLHESGEVPFRAVLIACDSLALVEDFHGTRHDGRPPLAVRAESIPNRRQ